MRRSRGLGDVYKRQVVDSGKLFRIMEKFGDAL
jgi:hypothetical protein